MDRRPLRGRQPVDSGDDHDVRPSEVGRGESGSGDLPDPPRRGRIPPAVSVKREKPCAGSRYEDLRFAGMERRNGRVSSRSRPFSSIWMAPRRRPLRRGRRRESQACRGTGGISAACCATRVPSR
ncbi:MAG: hypothetical protein MZV64_29665 [Ignavibacteriales bacterium]|nr:hypothetical protein [Ignavibacteriales bacterium]